MIEQQGGEQAVGPVPATTVLDAGALTARGLTDQGVSAHRKMRTDERIFLWVSRFIVWVSILIVIVPVLLVLIAALTAGNSLLVTSLVPEHFSWEHFQNVFDPSKTSIFAWLRNSFIVGVGTGVLAVLFVSTAGYAFSRFRFPGKRYGLMTMLLIQMFPAQMAFIALYFFLLKIGLLNTLQGLILVFLGGGIAFNTWLFKGYVDSLPTDLEESAYVDGANRFQAYWRIILPLTRPMMAVIFLFQFIGVYNDYILTSFLITDPTKYTVTVGLRGFINNQFGQAWNDFAAGALIAALPVCIVFLIMQRWLVSGLASGAVKG